MIGKSLGPYQVVAKIGEGGMGEVYRARDTDLDRDVALKILPEAVANDPDRLMRFTREAKTLATLNHPNIATIYGIESHAIVMELVDGPTLGDVIAGGRSEGEGVGLSLDDALPIARQVATALAAAHDQNVVHRDLKPANIKVRADGTVKVLDFGLAKAIQGDESGSGQQGSSISVMNSPTMTSPALTAMGMILGTAAYMSPEQAKGRPVDQRADVWAFGVVLYEMLTGRGLFRGEDVSDILAEVLKTEPDWQALPASAPTAVRRLLGRCLTRDPAKRLRNLHDAVLEIDDALQNPDRVDAQAPAAEPVPARSRLVPALAIAIAGILTGVAGATWRGTPPEAPDVRFVLTPGAPGNVLSVAVAPDGRRVVYEVANEPRLFMRSLDAFDEEPIPNTEGTSSNFFFSPDSEWLAFYQAGKLKRLRLSGGDPVVICDATGDSPGGSWAPDGTILFTPSWAGAGLWRVDANGGTPTQLTTPDASQGQTGHFWPFVLPGGKAALFTVFGGTGVSDSKVAVLDFASGEIDILFDGARPHYVSSGHVLFYHQGDYQLVGFDASSRQTTSDPVPVLPEARRPDPLGDNPNLVSVSDTGVLTYVPGQSILDAPASRFVWIARDGQVEPLPLEGNHGDFHLSPEGRRVAVIRFSGGENQVWLYDLTRGSQQQLTRGGQNFSAFWHPEGRVLSVSSQTAGSFDVLRLAADGSGTAEPLLVTGDDEAHWRWAPDGRSALFAGWTTTGRDLRIVDVGEPENPRVVVTSSAGDASISPDGAWFAYQSGGDLFVSPYPAATSRVLIMTDAEEPRWSPTSKALFFVHERRLKVASYTVRGDAFDVGAPTELFAVPGDFSDEAFEVSPDGQRFLFRALVDEAGAAPAIRVVVSAPSRLSGAMAR